MIDSKQWTDSVHQSIDGLVWHNHYCLDRTLATLRWQAETLGCLLGVSVGPLVCMAPASRPAACAPRRGGRARHPAPTALGYEQVLSDADVELYAATARMRLRPAV